MGGACEECHVAKVKCDKAFPCSRCVRLELRCVPHVSRQGQGSKKRKRKANDETAANGDGHCRSEDGALLAQLSANEKKNHFGVHYLIRSWISFAFRRRSFSLLSRACSLSVRLGISMDTMLCQTQQTVGMDFLPPILLTPKSQQQVLTPNPLQWSDLPLSLLQATGCVQKEALGDRWIWVREMNKGMSRYLTSPAFERDIAPKTLLEETWRTNVKGVPELFVKDVSKNARGVAHQVSLHATPETPPQCSKLSRVEIKKKNNQEVEVDQVSCIDIVNLDLAFMVTEYVPTGNAASTPINSTASTVARRSSSILNLDLPLLNLDDFTDDNDLNFFFRLVE